MNLIIVVVFALLILCFLQQNKTMNSKMVEGFAYPRLRRWGRRYGHGYRFGRRNRGYIWGRKRWGPRKWKRIRWRKIPHHLTGPFYRRAYNHWYRYWRGYDMPYRTWYYKYFIHSPTYYIPNLYIPYNVGYYSEYFEPLDKPNSTETEIKPEVIEMSGTPETLDPPIRVASKKRLDPQTVVLTEVPEQVPEEIEPENVQMIVKKLPQNHNQNQLILMLILVIFVAIIIFIFTRKN